MNDTKNNAVPLSAQGRSQSQSIEGMDLNLFPFDAFKFDNANITASPILSMQTPWAFDVGEISVDKITNFSDEVRTAAEVDEINAAILALEQQVSSGYETWFYDEVPTSSNEPAVNWTTTALKEEHVGDTYYDQTGGKVYHWVEQPADTFLWVEFQDSGILAAMEAAAAAQDTADNKRRVFTSTPVVPYDVGDLWTRGSSLGVYACVTAKASGDTYAEIDWDITTDATNDDSLNNFVDVTYTPFVADVEALISETESKSAFLYAHMDRVSKQLSQDKDENGLAMSQISMGQHGIDLRVMALDDKTDTMSESILTLDARADSADVLLSAHTSSISDNIGLILDNEQAITTKTDNSAFLNLKTDVESVEVTLGAHTGTLTIQGGLISDNAAAITNKVDTSAFVTLETTVNDATTGLTATYNKTVDNADLAGINNTALISLNANSDLSSIMIKADKVTLDGTVNINDVLTVDGSVVKINGHLDGCTGSFNGIVEVVSTDNLRKTIIHNGDITFYTRSSNGSSWITIGTLRGGLDTGTPVLKAPQDFRIGDMTVGRGNNNIVTNVALGFNALETNTSGSSNIAVGYSALYSNTTGSNNIGIGGYSLSSNTTGQFNIAMGWSALQNNITGTDNVGIGSFSLSNNTSGHGNIGIGYRALKDNTTGGVNIGIGTDALLSNTRGVSNIGIGASVLYSTTTGYNNIGMGAHTLYSNTTGSSNIGIGVGVLYANTTGVSNVAIGENALVSNVDGWNNTGLGSNALSDKIDLHNTTGVGYNAQVTGSNQMMLGDSYTTVYTHSGVVQTSDRRDKTDIEATKLGLDFILKLRPVEYKWDFRESYIERIEEKDEETEKITFKQIKHAKDGSKKRNRPHQGFIAQEVKELMNELGEDFGGYKDSKFNGGKDHLALGYEEFIAPIVKAIQELNAEVKQLKDKIV